MYYVNFIQQLKEKAIEVHRADRLLYERLSKEFKEYQATAQETIEV